MKLLHNQYPTPTYLNTITTTTTTAIIARVKTDNRHSFSIHTPPPKMSSNTIFTSFESQKRWVSVMNKNFPQQHTVDIDFSPHCCVFKVPTTLTQEKPEAYAPQHLGLGPYHHLHPELYTMQNQKLAAVKKFLGPKNLHSFPQVVQALFQMEPVLRACYDHYLDLDVDTLAWIIAIDGLYLLQFLKNGENVEQGPEIENLSGDVLMLENQIPVILLKKIQQVLEMSTVDDDCSLLFQTFCLKQSPLNLLSHQTEKIDEVHLLHFMYCSIVNNGVIQHVPFTTFSFGITRVSMDQVAGGVEFLAERGLPGAETAGKILSFIKNIPWEKILGLCKKDGLNGQNPSVKEIDIPSVSEMTEIAGIKFTLTPGGIRNVKYEDHEEIKNFYLPVIKLNHTSEIILRNLVAYEAASAKTGSTPEFAEYVDLICGIIDSPKDVNILRKENIIESELCDDEIASIFNGIGKSTKKKGEKSNIVEAVGNVNTTYDNVRSLKVKRLVAKYFYIFLKISSAVVSVAVVVLLVLQAFCSVFGCGRWFGRITTQGQSLVFSY